VPVEASGSNVQLLHLGDLCAGDGVRIDLLEAALTLSILLMYTLHEIQLAQERLVLDAENYADEELISRLHSV